MSPGNPCILVFKGQGHDGQGHDAQKHCQRGSWRSCGCWFLLVMILLYKLPFNLCCYRSQSAAIKPSNTTHDRQMAPWRVPEVDWAACETCQSWPTSATRVTSSWRSPTVSRDTAMAPVWTTRRSAATTTGSRDRSLGQWRSASRLRAPSSS